MIISAAGLGISVVLRMKDLVRLEVPAKLKESENDIRCTVLENITDRFSSECELYKLFECPVRLVHTLS